MSYLVVLLIVAWLVLLLVFKLTNFIIHLLLIAALVLLIVRLVNGAKRRV